MTTKEKILVLKEANPNAGATELGRYAGMSRETVRWHLYSEETKNKRRSYHRGWQKERSTKVRRRLIDLLGGKCLKCGYDKCPEAMDFHHRDSEQKEDMVSNLLLGRFERALEEAQKCDLLCCRCHRELHAEQATLGPH